jgi:RimJ/RimL family protein N-acetyltransferase
MPEIQIETARLRLRMPQLSDLDPWAEMMADEPTARFIGGPVPRAVSVLEKDTGRWIGRLGPWRPEGWPGTEIGWALVREAWGKGYATEGAIAATDWAFDHLGWTNVIHSIDPANTPSQQVAQRLGSRNLGRGQLPPPLHESIIDLWGQSREEWRARAGARSS